MYLADDLGDLIGQEQTRRRMRWTACRCLTNDAEMLMYLAALFVPGVVGGRVVVFLNRTGDTRSQVRQLDGRAANAPGELSLHIPGSRSRDWLPEGHTGHRS